MDEGKLSGGYMSIHNFGKGGLRPEYGKKAVFLLVLTSFSLLCSFTATTKAVSLIISNINRPFYQSWYDNLYVSQEQYVDRTYTFTDMPPFVQGYTYIKTENDDKGSTGTSFLTFDINQTARVYVAHDDRIVSKPSWMSTFTDTGDALVTSEDDNSFSLYYKDFAAGTVTLGGNFGSGYSMYSVVVVPTAATTPNTPRPVDGGSTDREPVVLSWTGSGGDVSHDVYLGTNETAVASASKSLDFDGDINDDGHTDWLDVKILSQQWLDVPGNPSADLNNDGDVNFADYCILANDWQKYVVADPEYKGNQTRTFYTDSSLAEGVTYYWRIDEVDGIDISKGPVWSFTTIRDLYSDTWVAVDDLGRALPDYAQCGPPRDHRYSALFYYIWHGEHGTGGPYDITELLAVNPSNPSWGPSGTFHHWGQSELGYYLSDDEYVMRKHAHMIADADIDVIVFDVTNGWTYKDNYKTLCDVFMQIRSEGGTTPQICFMANAYADNVVPSIYNALYSPNLYPELWFYWKGKPLILAPLDGMEVGGRTINYSQEMQDYFNMRYSWTWMSAGYDIWKWMDYYPQQYSWHESSSVPEQLSVSAGIVPHANQGRSFQNNTQPAHDVYGLTGYEEQGLCFAEQFTRLDTIDPEFLFITQWNEWVAQRQIATEGRWFLGEQLSAGETWFIDEYNQEYSRDIEPMEDGHTDNYYYQMIDGIRKYKGIRQPQSASAATTITIDGSFSDWLDVEPEYRDHKADTTYRNAPGWGSAGTYTNTTGRNDFITAKVARDDTYIYFYIETTDNITSYTDPNWMMLFINADQDYSDGWQGYDYVVNLTVNNSTTTTLKAASGGWNWTNVDSSVSYQVSGNKMELRIQRSDIGQGSGSDPVAFDFHWSDNIQKTDDIIEFSISGDSAPNRRFNYRYETD